VTFDTGGISIKPADGMEKMKYDMAGAATMIGAMRAIALLKPKVKVTAIVCATENMPSGKAQKPGDVQIAMSANRSKSSIQTPKPPHPGRRLCYARQLGCTHLVDAATLTGAVVVALGYVNAGIFASTDELYERFARPTSKLREDVATAFGRRIQGELEVQHRRHGEFRQPLGRRNLCRMFLKEFAEDTPWITSTSPAPPGWKTANLDRQRASGIALRSLVEFVKGGVRKDQPRGGQMIGITSLLFLR